MATVGFSYFCTDKHGNVYRRYSAGHHAPRYKFASVKHWVGNTEPAPKWAVSFASTKARAEAVARAWRHDGRVVDAAEVAEVRAYKGRWKHEPESELNWNVED